MTRAVVWRRAISFSLLFCCGFPPLVAGQAAAPATGSQTLSQGAATVEDKKHEWMVIGSAGVAFTLLNSRADRHFLMPAVNWSRTVTPAVGPGFLKGRLQLAIEGVPIFAMFQSEPAYGVGISPVFFRWNFERAADRTAMFLELAGGFLYTHRKIPEEISRFNYTAHTGFGFRVPLRDDRAFVFGYRFHHISNGGTFPLNPSVNSNAVLAGVSFR